MMATAPMKKGMPEMKSAPGKKMAMPAKGSGSGGKAPNFQAAKGAVGKAAPPAFLKAKK